MSKGTYIGAAKFIKRILPSGYTQVEYIESTGSQYVDTGFTPNQDTRVVANVLFEPGVESRYLLGARKSSGTSSFIFSYSSNGYYVSQYGNTTDSIDEVFNRSVPFVLDKNKKITYIDGVKVKTATSATFTAPGTMYLFGINQNGSALLSASRFYSCLVYDNDILIRDYVPCTNASGVAGLYDVVNETFYVDAAGGAFIAGDEVTDTAVARKVKMCYLGIPVEGGPTVVSGSNISTHFNVVDDTDGGFTGSGGVFSSVAESSTNTSESTWTAKRDFTSISFDYIYGNKPLIGGEFTITVAGNEVVNTSTSGDAGSWSGSINAGETIVFYSKNGKTASTISNVTITEDVSDDAIPKSYARKIKKVYIGVNGVAELCYIAPKYTYTNAGIGSSTYALVSYSTGQSTKQTVYYSDSFTFDDQTGLFTLDNPLTVDVGYSNYSDGNVLKGKYYIDGRYASKVGSHTEMYLAPTSTSISRDTNTPESTKYYRTGFLGAGRKYTSEPL